MARDLSAAMQTALQDRVLSDVAIGRLDIASDPVYFWTGPGLFAPSGTGDAALDGNVYDSDEAPADISEISEDPGGEDSVLLTFPAHDMDQNLLRQIVRDRRQWRLRKAWLWKGLLDTSDLKTVIANPMRAFTGVITNVRVMRDDEGAGVAVTLGRDYGLATGTPYRIINHARLWPGDTYSAYLLKLANKPGGLEASDVRANVGLTPTQQYYMAIARSYGN